MHVDTLREQLAVPVEIPACPKRDEADDSHHDLQRHRQGLGLYSRPQVECLRRVFLL